MTDTASTQEPQISIDPPLTADQAEQVQAVINAAVLRAREEGIASVPTQALDAKDVFPRVEGDVTVLGPEIFTDAKGEVISWKGENYVKQKPVNYQPPLEQYKVGEQVEALKNGLWLPGKISSIEKYSHFLHVDTERGPVTIGSSNGVRRPAPATT